MKGIALAESSGTRLLKDQYGILKVINKMKEEINSGTFR